MAAAESYPVRVDAALDTPLSRWLWIVKWLLVIPAGHGRHLGRTGGRDRHSSAALAAPVRALDVRGHER